MTFRRICAIAAFALLSLASYVAADAMSITWHTIDCGGGYSAAGDLELEGTLGQADARPAGGPMTGGIFELTGGFWAGAVVGMEIPGDCNGDANVDLRDFGDLADCLAGPQAGIGPGCSCFDADSDGDNDLADFAQFQTQFTGTL